MTDMFAHLHDTVSGDDASVHHTTVDHHADHGIHFGDDQANYDHPDMLGHHSDVPWLNFHSHDAPAEAQHGDAVANAAHAASGTPNLPVGAFSTGVPWQQITPDAMHHDSDGDGIPDTLDNHVGPGA